MSRGRGATDIERLGSFDGKLVVEVPKVTQEDCQDSKPQSLGTNPHSEIN
jgi:hypothetical protein